MIMTEESELFNEFGVSKVVISPKPVGTLTTFASKADSPTERGEGAELIFSLDPTDSVVTKNFAFLDNVCLYKGTIFARDAPLGAWVRMSIIDADDVEIAVIIDHAFIYGAVTFHSDDAISIPVGNKIQISVYNSSGLDEQDAPKAFKLCGFFKLFKKIP